MNRNPQVDQIISQILAANDPRVMPNDPLRSSIYKSSKIPIPGSIGQMLGQQPQTDEDILMDDAVKNQR